MKKTALFLVSLLMMLGSAEAQNGTSGGRFEWVRGYAPGEHVSIIGAVTDSVGNLYILGSFNFESRWENGELIMPITPHNGAQNGVNTLIAKISPEGEMVWKKVIHGNYCPSQPHDIKAVGDTAFACLVTMPLASRDFYLYYLDTLIEATSLPDQPWPDYPMNAKGVEYKCLALITFDFDGNVLEQHFLQMSFLDRYGEDIYYVPSPGSGADDFLSTDVPVYPSFAIDGNGNIYLCRRPDDDASGGPYNGEYSVSDGTIGAVKFWCDRRLVGMIPADSILYTLPQIIKFTPHFDTLIYSRNVFQSQSTQCGSVDYIQTDQNGDLYVIGKLSGNDSSYMVLDSVRNIFINISRANLYKGYLVKFDSTLNVKYCISLEDSIIHPDINYSATYFHDITFDYDSNLMFLCASTGRASVMETTFFYSILMYHGATLERLKNDAFIMAFSIDSAQLHSYGRVPAKIGSNILPSSLFEHNNIVCQKNRSIIQTKCMGGFYFPNHVIEWPNLNTGNLGYVIFDYQGNVVGGDSFSAFSSTNRPGPLAIRDSTLYLMNRLSSDATFGDIYVPSRGGYFACIAKYVDTAFMTPYVYPAPHGGGEKIDRVKPGECAVYPNPTLDELTIKTDERIVQVSAFSLSGIQSNLKTNGNTVDVSTLPQGVYLIEIITEKTKYYTKFIKQ